MNYKYFSPTEVKKWGLDYKLWTLLDKAREISQIPFIITSGYRTPELNESVGGVSNSSHLKGLAVDLACTNNQVRSKILWGLLNFRNEVFVEICESHIHVDIDSSIHPLGSVMWSKDK